MCDDDLICLGDEMSNWKSRKLWLAIIASLVAFSNAFWGLGFTSEQVWEFLIPVLAYIGVEGIRDIKGS